MSERRVVRTADVVVVGAGAVGASAAYHLAAAGAGRVLVVEREATVGTGSTGRCAGGFRHQFSSAVNIALSQASIPMIKAFSETHDLPLEVSTDGYLFLVRDEETWQEYLTAAGLQRRMGVDVRLLSTAEVTDLVPGLRVDDVVGATYCPDDGIADPAGLTQGYIGAARRRGVEVALGTAAVELLTRRGRIVGLRTTAGDVGTETIVNATGPWAADLALTAGVEVPVWPLGRRVVVTGPFRGAPERRTLVVDAGTGFYFHREGPGVLMGMGARDERPGFAFGDGFAFGGTATPDDRFLSEELIPVAVSVLPELEGASVAHQWIGYYEMTPDAHPVLGPVAGVPGLFLANGFSGHGFQHAPIVGKLLAEWICDGAARSVDVSALGLERFAEGKPLREARVV